MVDPRDLLIDVIKPTLGHLGMGGPVAEALVLGTAMCESGLSALHQENGVALGLWQMEPATAQDIWQNYLNYRTDLRMKIASLLAVWPDGVSAQLETNLCYGAAMCRVKYQRAPAQLPGLQLGELAAYWKQWYNTPKGAGTIQDFETRASACLDPHLWRLRSDSLTT